MSKVAKKVLAEEWLDKDLIDQYIPDEEKGHELAGFSLDLIQLASYRRVISNFVSILTNQNITVQFFTQGENTNFTDGEVVWLSASIRRKEDFDWSVGLALHEGSHIKLSNFDVVKSMFMRVPLPLPKNIKEKAKAKNLTNEQLAYLCKWIFNFVEDRYVDSFIYNEAPGYRGYYQAMYDKFWNSEEISEALKSKMYRVPSLVGYEMRVINLTNPDTDLDALPGLRKISDMVSISSIFRLQTTAKRLELSIEVLEVILDNVGQLDKQKPEDDANSTIKKVHQKLAEKFIIMPGQGQGQPQPSKEGKPSPTKEDLGGDDPFGSDDKKKKEKGDGKGEGAGDTADIQDKIENPAKEIDNTNDEGDSSQFSKNEVKKIHEEFEKQKKLLKHDYEGIKEGVSKAEQSILDVIEKYGIVLVPTGFCMGTSLPGDYTQAAVDCIVVQKLTRELIESGKSVFPMASVEHAPGGEFKPIDKYDEAVSKGFILGRALGKKLQVRGEINVIKYIRKMSGKIERRLLAGIGAGMDDVFNKTFIERFNKARLHISVDASSSMACDEKWLPTMKCLVAVCVAASMVENLSVSVSFRCTHNLADGTCLPYVVMAYDSEKDKISKVRKLFPYLTPNGATPEGLAFEAIMDKFIIGKRTDGQDHYFVNLSDGEPCYSLNSRTNKYKTNLNYNGETATLHTKKQVEKIRMAGVSVLSYFISSGDVVNGLGYNPWASRSGAQIPYKDTLKAQFEKMYGRDSQFIDVTNIFEIAKTMNKLFLSKV